nr:retrovirus-related Pol polyprotein from transposon TNT 1-94 [Tanacetum cinerariifolium]
YCSQSKAYRLYDPTRKTIVVRRDVVFDEQASLDWNDKEIESSNNKLIEVKEISSMNTEKVSPVEEQSPTPTRSTSSSSLSTSVEVEGKLDNEDDDVTLLALFVGDPVAVEEALQQEEWREEEVYVSQTPGFEKSNCPNKVLRLRKALYGLKQAPRAWYSKIDEFFRKQGFERSNHEPTLYVKKEGSFDLIIVSLYVDDMIYTGSSMRLISEFKNSMMNMFDTTDLGELHYFLRLQISQTSAGIFMSQRKYIEDTLQKFNMTECKPAPIPMNINEKLQLLDGFKAANVKMFRSLIGRLIYLTHSRPDISFAVGWRFISLYAQSIKTSLWSSKTSSSLLIRHKELEDMRLFWITAASTVEARFKAQIEQIKEINPEAYEYLSYYSSKKETNHHNVRGYKNIPDAKVSCYEPKCNGFRLHHHTICEKTVRKAKNTAKCLIVRASLDFFACSKDKMSQDVITTRKIDRLARSLLIQGLLNDIYSLIDSNKTAKDLWDALERQMRGSKYGEQDRKAAILFEYKTFKATKREQLLNTYLCYLEVINDLKKCGYQKDNCELNYRFLNNLQPD